MEQVCTTYKHIYKYRSIYFMLWQIHLMDVYILIKHLFACFFYLLPTQCQMFLTELYIIQMMCLILIPGIFICLFYRPASLYHPQRYNSFIHSFIISFILQSLYYLSLMFIIPFCSFINVFNASSFQPLFLSLFIHIFVVNFLFSFYLFICSFLILLSQIPFIPFSFPIFLFFHFY